MQDFTSSGDVVVEYPEKRWRYNPKALTKVICALISYNNPSNFSHVTSLNSSNTEGIFLVGKLII